MRRATHRDIPSHIARRESFTGSSASARHDGHRYVVYSYDTAIATYTPDDGWTIPDVYYSRTTSRLQNIVRQYA